MVKAELLEEGIHLYFAGTGFRVRYVGTRSQFGSEDRHYLSVELGTALGRVKKWRGGGLK